MKFENIYKETEENMRLALLSLWAPGSHPMRSAIDELFDREPLLAEPVFQSTFGWEPSSDETWRSAINRDVWNKLEKIRENKAIEAVQSNGEYDQLLLYSSICNFLYDQRLEIAAVYGDKIENIIALLDKVESFAGSVTVTKPESTAIQQKILDNIESYRTAIMVAFES